MQENPFKNPQSPILHLYARSRQKSQQNRTIPQSRSSSFQNFKVNTIRTALEKHHIIQKVQHKQRQRQITRQRQLSKFYGIDCLRQSWCMQRVKTEQPQLPKINKQGIPKLSQRRRSSDRMSSLLNIRPAYIICQNGERAMSYSSNYVINQQSTSDSERSSQRSMHKKISIASQIENNPYQEGNFCKKSRFIEEKKRKIDEIRQDYFDKDNLLTINWNRRIKHNWRMI